MLLPNTQTDGMTKFSCSLNKLIFDKQKKSSQFESFFNLERIINYSTYEALKFNVFLTISNSPVANINFPLDD